MGTLIYCDQDDCQNSDHSYDKGIYPILNHSAKKLYKKGWVASENDVHLCQDCIDIYFNQDDEQLVVIGGYIEIGNDFKE